MQIERTLQFRRRGQYSPPLNHAAAGDGRNYKNGGAERTRSKTYRGPEQKRQRSKDQYGNVAGNHGFLLEYQHAHEHHAENQHNRLEPSFESGLAEPGESVTSKKQHRRYNRQISNHVGGEPDH